MRTGRIIFFAILLLSGCSGKEYSMHTSPRIAFFGDSITELGVQPNGYVSLVNDSLRTLGRHCEIVGAGISGNKVTDLKNRLQNDVLSKKPDVVVIYIGINDVWHFLSAAEGLSGTPKDQYENILEEIVGDVQSAGATVVLCTPSVIGEKMDGSNEMDGMLDEYSGISRKIARRRNAVLLDLRKEFLSYLKSHNPLNLEKDILTYDGVHLNDAGNRFVAGQVMEAFNGMNLFPPEEQPHR